MSTQSKYVYELPNKGEYVTTKTVSAAIKTPHPCWNCNIYTVQFTDNTSIEVTEAEYDFRKSLLLDIEDRHRK